MPKDATRFKIVVADAGGTVPVVHRLRSWLKCGLRSFGLRCLEFDEETPAQVDTPTPASGKEE